MAIYGLSVGINGVREGAELWEERELLRSSSALAHFALVQAALQVVRAPVRIDPHRSACMHACRRRRVHAHTCRTTPGRAVARTHMRVQTMRACPLQVQVRWLLVANLAAEIVAGPLLCAGQGLMALGSPGLLGKVALLVTGGVLSALSIVIKTLVDLDTQARFGSPFVSFCVRAAACPRLESCKVASCASWLRVGL